MRKRWSEHTHTAYCDLYPCPEVCPMTCTEVHSALMRSKRAVEALDELPRNRPQSPRKKIKRSKRANSTKGPTKQTT